MRIAVDARACLGSWAGVGRYTIELTRALARRGEDVSLWFAARQVCAVRSRLPPELADLGLPLHTRRISNALLYSPAALRFWSHWPRWVPPPRLLPRDIDVFHGVYWPLPLARRLPLVLTIHDLLGLRQPDWCTAGMIAELRMIQRLAPRAARIVTDSEATRQDVLEFIRVDPARVTAVHLGVGAEFSAPQSPDDLSAVRARHGLERPYVCALGTLEPRKNLPRVVAAYDRVCERLGAEWDLALIGSRGWAKPRLAEYLDRSRTGRVVTTGYVAAADLPALLQGASAMLYPSLGEGFGLPPLEAMAAGCPVITSSVSSLPEVVGDAALTVEPDSEEAIADALERLLTDQALADDLRRRGRERAARFTWDTTAERTVAVYQQAVAAR